MSVSETENLVLTINAGSSSLKIAAFLDDAGTPAEVFRVALDRHSTEAPAISGHADLISSLALPATRDYASFVVALIDNLSLRSGMHLVVNRVVHRVVHGGDESRECVHLDATEMARLHALSPLAPLHQPPALAIIDAVSAAQPDIAQFACFDTAFHSTIPTVAREYALPADIRARYPEIRGYGFHGLSCRSIVDGLRKTGDLPQRLVIAHLGSGASVTAVRDGKSVATSMGFSALDGVPMATRPGHLDPGVLLHLLRHGKPDVDALEGMLYRHSGLLGLSGISGDMRVLMASEDPRAKAALDFFVYRVATEIGALAVALGGLDAIAFTGGVGEHQPVICERIVERLLWINTELTTHVIACDEERVMASAAVPAITALRLP